LRRKVKPLNFQTDPLPTATLTVKDGVGNTATANYYVAIRDGSILQVKVNMAIDDGLWYLHKTLTRSTFGAGAPGFSQPYGIWQNGISGQNYVANQAANLNAFEVNGHLEAGPATDPYTETTARAMHYILTQLRYGQITPTQANPSGTITFMAASDDASANRYSVGVNQSPEMYELGSVMDAMVASGTQNAVSATGPAGVSGRKYIDLVKMMVNRYGYCQTFSGNGGGWYYDCRQNANDNSICQWAAIGLIAAADWGITIPQALLKWNQVWLQTDQETTNGSATQGGFGYSSVGYYPWGPYAVTPSGMVQMALNGIGRGSTTAGATGQSTAGGPKWEYTETMMRNNFTNPTGNGAQFAPRAYYYGLFSFEKSMLLHNTDGHPGSSPITMLHSQTAGVADIDWYADATYGIAPTLVATQDAQGFWNGHNFTSTQYTFETAWCIIMLNKTLFSAGAPVALATASPNPALPTDTISFDGSQSYQQDPTKQIVKWEWDFYNKNDGTVDATGPQVSFLYPNAQFGGSVTAKLTVTDSTGTKATTTVTITFKQPPVPPTANAGGPYTFCMNITPFFLDGSGSKLSDAGLKDPTCPTCPVETITTYAWDLAGQNTFTSATGVQPDVTSFYIAKGAGSYLAQLKVTDNTSLAYPHAGVGNLSSTASTQVTVKASCSCITDLAAAINPSNQPQLTWSNADNSAQYNVYRSTVSGGPYAKIATVSGAAPGYVDTSATPGNTYYYIVRSATLAGVETCQSSQVTATVNKIPTTTTVTSSANPSAYGQSITLTATVAPTAATGSVTFLDSGAMIGNGTVSNGVATMTTANLTAGSHNISAVYSGDSTYMPSTGTLTQVVNKGVVTLTWATPAPIVYGTPLSGTQLNATANQPGTMVYTPDAGAILSAGNQPLSVAFTPTDTNYAAATASVTLTIQPKPASVTPDPNGKSYGAADPAPLTGTLSGFLASDNVTATYTRTAGEAAGTYAITATLAPAGVLSNYTITSNTGTFTIGKLNASVTPAASSKNYGAADPTLTGTLSGFLASDGVTATYTRAAGEAVGTYAITATLFGAGLGNYNVTNNTGTFTINKASASVTPDSLSKNYGAADPALTGTLSGFLAADGITASYTRAPGEAVGTYTVTATLSGAALGNYNITTNTGTFTITKIAASVTPAAGSKTYGAADPALTGTLTGFLAADGITASYSRTPGEAVGTYTISATLSGAGLSNYNVTSNTGTFTIGKLAASVTPNAASKTYGSADPALTGTLAGFLPADGITATYSRTPGEAVGTYTISATLSGAGLSNYNVTSNTATFTIGKLAASVTPNAASKTYGAADPALTGTLAGFLPADGITATYSRTPGETVGTYTISATLSGAGLSNYAVTSNTGTFTIGKLTASVTPNAASKTYGTADPALTGTLTGFLAADGITASYSRTPGEAVGTYTISATLSGAGLSNYNVTSNTGTFTIGKLAASVTPNAASKTYGTADPALTGTLTGFLAADGITATYSRTPGETVGTYTISATLSGAGLSNYAVTSNTATFTIGKLAASVTPNAASKTYGTADPALTGTLTGFLPADGITASYSRTPGEAVGTYTISATLSGAGLSNYNVTSNTAAFTIGKASLIVTSDPKTRFYQSPNPPFTGSVTGQMNGDQISATYSTTATVASAPGTYPITPALVDPANRVGNYNVTTNVGLLTVVPAPIVTVTPNPLAFGNQNLLSSVTLNVTVQNIGTAALSIAGVAIGGANAGDFSVVSNCGTTLAAGANCTLPVTFVPHTLGAKAAVLTVTDNNGGYAGSTQTVNLTGSSVLGYGIYVTDTGCGALKFSGQTFTDSYDSSAGPYATSKANTGGNVAVNGNADMTGQSTIFGKLFVSNPTAGKCSAGGPSVTLTGQAQVTEGYVLLPKVAFTTPAVFTAGTTDVKANNNTSIAPGSYRNIQVSGNGTVLTLAPGTYNVNSIKLSGHVSIVVSPTGPVTINVAGAGDNSPVDLSGGAMAAAGSPANFTVIYGGNGTVKLTGDSDSYGILYAPNADVSLTGKGDWYGSMVAGSLTDSGQSAIHYDRGLGK